MSQPETSDSATTANAGRLPKNRSHTNSSRPSTQHVDPSRYGSEISERELLPNAPDCPTAQARSDHEIVRLWLAKKADHTQRAYRADIEEFIGQVDKPIQSLLLKDVQQYKQCLTYRDFAGTLGRAP